MSACDWQALITSVYQQHLSSISSSSNISLQHNKHVDADFKTWKGRHVVGMHLDIAYDATLFGVWQRLPGAEVCRRNSFCMPLHLPSWALSTLTVSS